MVLKEVEGRVIFRVPVSRHIAMCSSAEKTRREGGNRCHFPGVGEERAQYVMAVDRSFVAPEQSGIQQHRPDIYGRRKKESFGVNKAFSRVDGIMLVILMPLFEMAIHIQKSARAVG